MPKPTLKDKLRNKIQYIFFWFSVRKNLPKEWFEGGYSTIKIVRFSLVIFALLNFSAVALGSPNWNNANAYTLWLGFASAAYIMVAVIYFLGLRMWYGPTALFLIVSALINYGFDSRGGPDALSPINKAGFNDLIGLSWIFLVVVGLVLMRYDKGSKINELLSQS